MTPGGEPAAGDAEPRRRVRVKVRRRERRPPSARRRLRRLESKYGWAITVGLVVAGGFALLLALTLLGAFEPAPPPLPQ